MDIIDIMLAKALTPQGQTNTYVAKANAAAAKAEKAKNDAESAIASVTAAADTIAEKQAEAEELLATAQEALETVQEAQINTIDIEDIDDEIDKVSFELNQTNNTNYKATGYRMVTPSNSSINAPDIIKLYKNTGNNEDGSMTQAAITTALAQKADTSTTATKAYVDNAIARIPTGGGSSGGGVSNLGSNNAGKIVVVGADGNIKAGEASEETIIKALIKAGTYSADGTLGLIIDYENKSFERTQDAASRRAGSDFDGYTMYGGRMRCNVADDGTITAFYGDSNYREDGSNGQVMIYQPKFYYQRTFIKDSTSSRGTTIQKESLILSAEERAGFILHPLFKLGNEELDYVLLPAFEGSIYDTSEDAYLLNNENTVAFAEDKLSSIAGAKIFNGVGKTLNLTQVKAMASNRGEGWQLTNLEFESANQMLEMVEFGTMNGQNALEKGVVNISRSGATDCAVVTGSTSSLGNGTGAAPQTFIDRDGARETVTVEGQRAISYRGMENPWGSMWRLIADLTARGGGSSGGGIPYCDDVPLNFQLPAASASWVSAMGYQNLDFDWAYLPIECASNANSAFPVGDSLWTNGQLNGTNLMAIGGLYSSGDNAGPFDYCADIEARTTLRYFNGRIMYIPTKNATYEANINKWRQHYGG